MRILSIVLLLLITSLTFAQEVESPKYDKMLSRLLSHSVTEVGVDEISGDENIVFLDAREEEEFDVSHIKSAVWVGYDDFDISRLDSVSKDQKIVVYCSVGYRSEKISEKLINAGYEDVSNLYGSIFEWVNQGKPVYNNRGEITIDVHAFDKSWGKWLLKGNKVY